MNTSIRVNKVRSEGQRVSFNRETGTIAPKVDPRPLHVIAKEIFNTWPHIYFGAAPYLEALNYLDSINDTYGQDPARDIVNYFLANAGTWRGADARRIKAELKDLLK